MLRNHQSIRRQHLPPSRTTQKPERLGILRLRFIRRIEKDHINRLHQFGQSLQYSPYAAIFHGKAPLNLQRSQIRPQRSQCRHSILRKPDMTRTPAQRLNANRSRTSVKIHKTTAFEPWRKYIEQPLPQPVAGRTRLHSLRG